MFCDYCSGAKAIFYHDKYDCAFIDEDGTMRVYVDGAEAKFKVNRCPMCGRLFKGVNDLNIRQGDDIWYADVHDGLCVGDEIWYVDVDAAECYIEHANVEYVEIENGSVDWFSAKFDNGDTDQFGPCALGQFCFKSYEAAQSAWNKKHVVAK